MAALTVALENYKADNGDYPPGTNVNGAERARSNSFLLTSLMPKRQGLFRIQQVHDQRRQQVVDPFGENYGYQYPGDANRNGTNFFDLFSRCASSNTDQWKVNW